MLSITSVDEVFMHHFEKMSSASGVLAPRCPTRELPLDPAGDFRPSDPLMPTPEKNPADAHGIGQEVTTRLVLAMVISRLDYCNAALAGLLQATELLHHYNVSRTQRLA